MTKPLLLLDGDIFLYEAANVTEFAMDYGSDVWVMSSNLGEAQELFTSQVQGIKDKLETDRIVVCLSDVENFRKELTDTYKSQRKSTRKPLIFPALRDWVKDEYKAVIRPKLEADDVMGILATEPNAKEQRIIVSSDKDMQTIPGWLYRQGELREVTVEEARYYWLTQTLTGDATDGYKGCPGVGPVGAKKVLGTKPDYGAVEMTYIKAGLTRDDCLLNARLARILRWENWDRETQTVKLWEPSHGV